MGLVAIIDRPSPAQPNFLDLSLSSRRVALQNKGIIALPECAIVSCSSSAMAFHLSATPNSASSAGDDPNSNHPSPSLLREVMEAVKQLHATATGSVPSFNSNPASFNTISEEPDQNPTSFSKVEKLEQIKASALSLKQKQDTDRNRLLELLEARNAIGDEIIGCIMVAEEHRRRLNTKKPPTHHIDTIIMKFTRKKELTVEIVELSKVLTSSRLASFNEILQNLSQIRKDNDEDFGKIRNELREGLIWGIRLEEMKYEKLAKKMGLDLASIEDNISNYFILRDNCSCTSGHFCGGHGVYGF